ncbi:hypothetical protein [Antribacter gilvus]|uniref:hypothetical protein n=1 Tax=Antribacter gilvus TaxID=2304675 RepID=UPI000F7B4ED5|nr:hypothetical protein [Antribacter gilvus]
MRKYFAATAVLTSALLLAACSDNGATTTDDAATASPSTTASETSSAVYDTVGACRTFFYGEGSLNSYIQTAAPLVSAPLDETTTGPVTSASQRIAALIPLVDEETVAYLEPIKLPFDQAIEGTVADPADVTTAVDEYAAACETAGYTG